MKDHLTRLHKSLATHPTRLAALHKAHSDGLDDGDPHCAFHSAAAAEHSRMAKIHEDESETLDALPVPEMFGTGVHGVPAKSAMGLMRKRGLEMVSRIGAPTTFSEIIIDENDLVEAAAEGLDPHLRKAVVGE